jgi:hypothetical protein
MMAVKSLWCEAEPGDASSRNSLMSGIERFYVDKVSDISADQKAGIVKITFSVEGAKGGDVMQMIVSAGHLHQMFGQIGETMQKNFGGGPRPGGKGPGQFDPKTQFKDLTQE